MEPYAYTPLAAQHIRLLTLYPGHPDDAIEVFVDHVFFTEYEYPPYEALSYCWGSEDNPRTIEIHPDDSLARARHELEWETESESENDSVALPSPSSSRSRSSSVRSEARAQRAAPSSFSVSSNLHSALLHLRLRSEPRILWIDAICINQADNEEKSIQVRKMGSIYHKAESVIVWLGPASDHSHLAIDALDYLGRQVFWDNESSSIMQARDCDPTCKKWYRPSHALLYDVDTWTGMADVLSRPWFTRVWIWQEIWLADQSAAVMICGRAKMSWEAFRNSIMCLLVKQIYGSQPELSGKSLESSLGQLWRLVSSKSAKQQNILGLLDEMRNISSCYDPRDRLYALLDLASNDREVEIEPDYNKPVARVFYDYSVAYARRCESSTWSLFFLAQCEIDSWQEGPTWVPNWNKPFLRGALVNNLSAHSGPFRGSSQLIDGMTLRVNAVRCGVVQSYSSLAPAELSIEIFLSLIRDWLFGISDGHILDRILVVLIDGMLSSRMGPESPIFEDAQAFLKRCLAASPNTPPSADFFSPPSPLIFSYIKRFVAGRCLFKTITGQWGLGHPGIQAGDLVYSIIGCGCLILLRQDKDQKYIIVGECSLDGFSDLEAFLGPLPSNYHVEEDINRWASDMWFVNEDGTKTRVDPRLGPSHPGWSTTKNDDEDRILWENIESGRKTLDDPRHSDVSFLRSRGVNIESIDIV